MHLIFTYIYQVIDLFTQSRCVIHLFTHAGLFLSTGFLITRWGGGMSNVHLVMKCPNCVCEIGLLVITSNWTNFVMQRDKLLTGNWFSMNNSKSYIII